MRNRVIFVINEHTFFIHQHLFLNEEIILMY